MLRPCETWKKQNKWHRVNSKFSFFSFSGKNCLPNAYKRGYKYKAQLLLYLNFKDCLIFQTIFRLFFSVACWCPFYWKPARSSTCGGLSGRHVTQSDIKCLRRKSSGAALVHNAKHLVSCYLSKVICYLWRLLLFSLCFFFYKHYSPFTPCFWVHCQPYFLVCAILTYIFKSPKSHLLNPSLLSACTSSSHSPESADTVQSGCLTPGVGSISFPAKYDLKRERGRQARASRSCLSWERPVWICGDPTSWRGQI